MTSVSTYSEEESGSRIDTEKPTSQTPTGQEVAGISSLPADLPPELNEACLLHGQEPDRDDVVIIISQLALKQIATHSRSDLQREVGGVLLGHPYQNDGRVILDVRAAIPAVSADHGPVHFTFTADAWSQLHKDRNKRYPELDIVGWFHTHPDLGVFYSSDDVVVHTAAFTLPWHVGMVVDPVRAETSFFVWSQDALAVQPGFYERLELEPASQLQWRVIPTEIWDHPYDYSDDGHSNHSGVYLAANSAPVIPGLAAIIGYALGALGLLLSLVMLLGWIMPQAQEIDRLQNMVVVLADSALADSNAALCPDPRLRLLSPLAGQRLPSGEVIDILGTAMLPDTTRYQIDARPAGVNARWATVDGFRGATKLDQIATWNTQDWPVGVYELRLIPVDSNNIPLPGSPPCAITVELAT